jgi:hypothetical protein
MSVHFFLGRTPSGVGVQADRQPLGHATGPVVRSERPSAPQRCPHRRQFCFILHAAHFGPPTPSPLGLGPAQLDLLGESADQGSAYRRPWWGKLDQR